MSNPVAATVSIFLPYKLVTKSTVVYRNKLELESDFNYDAILNASFVANSTNSPYLTSGFAFNLNNPTTHFNVSDVSTLITHLKNNATYSSTFGVRNPFQMESTGGVDALDNSNYYGHFNQKYIRNSTSIGNTSDIYRQKDESKSTEDDWVSFSDKSFEIVRNNAIMKTITGQFSPNVSVVFQGNYTTATIARYFYTNELNETASKLGDKLTAVVATDADHTSTQELLVSNIISQLNEAKLVDIINAWNSLNTTKTGTIDFLKVLKDANISVKLSLHVKDKVSLSGMVDHQTLNGEADNQTVGVATKELVTFTNSFTVPSEFATTTTKSDESIDPAFADNMDFKIVYNLNVA